MGDVSGEACRGVHARPPSILRRQDARVEARDVSHVWWPLKCPSPFRCDIPHGLIL